MVVVLGTLFIIFTVLRESALEGKTRLQLHLENDAGSAPTFGVKSSQDGLGRLAQMWVWPLDYLSLNNLLLVSLLVIFSLFLYRIGVIFVGLL